MRKNWHLLCLRRTYPDTTIGATGDGIAHTGEMGQEPSEAAQEEGRVDEGEGGVGQLLLGRNWHRGGGGGFSTEAA